MENTPIVFVQKVKIVGKYDPDIIIDGKPFILDLGTLEYDLGEEIKFRVSYGTRNFPSHIEKI
jgi:hypothetical protein